MRKTQSMLEYLGMLIMLATGIGIGAALFGVYLNNSLQGVDDYTKNKMPESFNSSATNTVPSTSLTNQTHDAKITYTADSRGLTMHDPSFYEGRPYFENKDYDSYYYHEGPSDMSNVPESGTVLDTTDYPTLHLDGGGYPVTENGKPVGGDYNDGPWPAY